MDTMIVRIPAVALRGMVILPGMIAHFDVSREKSIKAVEASMMDEQKIFLVAQRDVEQEEPSVEDLYKIGIIAEVRQVIKLQNNIVRILVEGIERADEATPYGFGVAPPRRDSKAAEIPYVLRAASFSKRTGLRRV